ncbi:nicotinate-nucleotide adenylyltransferase [Mycoplasmopsis californica]|uniref:Probable nicotinate-nucleotide adenylyltransferase n=1 Tax=Mycoplasmopsis equigenitalium TaxID=114883 RepID=A0ABY5J3F2_9BACT|nr:nicotinate-nucleotide adenylyltransferase [Mycoplasmopsis equigenitalium]UUD37061.1 nicotinate-nucleotide adenylyltransferase [Mycoplasmopsis equigenitalium]VEU69639.1 nicotinate-nucleotide adenylyltransferase [Mycoplasmopsis californica]
MKIGIFGGSFDPIHKGHVKIAKTVIDELNLDKLFFVPAYQNPFKTKKPTDPQHRVNMIKLVMPEKSEISMFEINRKGKSYSFETVNYFANNFPKDELFFILGSDNLGKLHKWEFIEDIATKTKIVIYKRTKTFNKTNVKRFNCLVLNNDLTEQSSTSYREGNLSMVDKVVQEYIGKNLLYIPELVTNSVSHARAQHMLAAGDFARNLARKHGFDEEVAYAAAAFHDITKELTPEEHKKIIKRYLNIDNLNPIEYHQLSGSLWLKHKYLVQNDEIVHAVSVHTKLALELNWLDKVVYMADKLCKGRRWAGIEKVRELAFSDFEKGFRKTVEASYNHIVSAGKKIENEEHYEKWIKG